MSARAAVQRASVTSGPRVVVYFAEIGSSQEIAALARAAHSPGSDIGCFVVVQSTTDFSHIRAISVSAAVSSISAPLLYLSENVALLMLAWFAGGQFTASMFVIGDAWISDRSDNLFQGRAQSVHAVIMGLMSYASQFLLIWDPSNLGRLLFVLEIIYCVTVTVTVTVIDTARTLPQGGKSKTNLRPRALLAEALTAF